MSRYFIFGFALTTFLIQSCANQVSPTGGDKDAAAPVITKTFPDSNRLMQRPKKITFYFDENIQTNNPNSTIIISPNPGKYSIQKSNRSLSILLNPDSLRPNTTYSVSLNDAISDLNEGNKGTYKTLLFSTGDHLDTGTLTGSIVTTLNSKNLQYKAALFSETEINYSVARYNRCNSKGLFTISALDSRYKQLVVWNDENNNNRADSTEEYGYIKQTRCCQDTVKINLYSHIKNNINYYNDHHLFYVSGLQTFHQLYLRDHVPSSFVFGDTFVTGDINFPIVNDDIKEKNYIKNNKVNSFEKHAASFMKTFDNTDSMRNIIILFNTAVKAINYEKIKCKYFNDTNKKCELNFHELYNGIKITTAVKGEPIELTFNKSAFLLVDDIPFEKEIVTNIEDNNSFGQLTLVNEEETDIYLSLKDNKGTQYFIVPKGKKEIFIPRGNYELSYFFDSDNNHILTPANIETQYEGEMLHRMKQIAVKPGMVNELLLKAQ